ncbi:TPP-dependent indolepyruvate ferredoxin oxidoreductase alpha subunit [Paenibacillus phyllosphaerae]|uniref:TPP-dependent indolepyruvate ferredoxin oxidoreductase alpha subunit n=1 Tax=Paenibacillus phyllosphaerae TaxID=274593 RepID=A0A7W5B0C6_9BACL|nr:hypothetical protein [Paenibacillus phyllosphaerae]MBB3112098.1 TPP-dependent indolepyruvate ferredoxin oxidoreductase alpha subunit [Paenibacillus phyllosphaerae]
MTNWKKACIAAAAAACLLAGTPAFAMAPDNTAAQPQTDRQPAAQEHEDFKDARKDWKAMRHDHAERRSQRLKEAAQYFGIKTEGKTDEQLRDELKKAREADPAKWNKFKAELKAKRLVRLQDEAKRLGIATEGKDAKALHEAIREKKKADCEKKKADGTSSATQAEVAPAPSSSAERRALPN